MIRRAAIAGIVASASIMFGSGLLVQASEPPAPSPAGFIERLLADVRARVDAAIVARPPKLVPPKKLAIKWKLRKLGSVELGAPLVALAGGDLDSDGTGELYAVTAREVIAIGLTDKRPRELGRVAFAGPRATQAPRDVVATAVVDGNALFANVSTWARGLRVTWRGGVLVADPGETSFVLCAGELAALAPGRNYFGEIASGTYGVRCTSALVDGDGYPLRTRAQLSLANKLDVAVERCAAQNLGCQPTGRYEYAGVGVAFEIADVDRDGKLEAIYAGAGAPGDPDVLKVVTLGDDDKKQAKLKKPFRAGGIAGIAIADLDGNGAGEVIAAVRLVGASRVDLWRIE